MKQVSRRFVVRGRQKIGIWLGQGIIIFLFVWINNKYKGSLKYIIVCIDYRLESQKYFDFFMARNGIILSFFNCWVLFNWVYEPNNFWVLRL